MLQKFLGTLKDAKLLVVEGTIYPLLTRLKNAGLSQLQMGRIDLWTTTEILWFNRNRQLFLKELNTTWSELQNAVTIVTAKNQQKNE